MTTTIIQNSRMRLYLSTHNYTYTEIQGKDELMEFLHSKSLSAQLIRDNYSFSLKALGEFAIIAWGCTGVQFTGNVKQLIAISVSSKFWTRDDFATLQGRVFAANLWHYETQHPWFMWWLRANLIASESNETTALFYAFYKGHVHHTI